MNDANRPGVVAVAVAAAAVDVAVGVDVEVVVGRDADGHVARYSGEDATHPSRSSYNASRSLRVP